MKLMLLITLWRWPLGLPHPAIFFSLDYLHTLSPSHTCLSATCTGRYNTQIHTQMPYPIQPVDDNLVEELRKCFISQLPLVDKACVPTVREAGGQMWPITLHPLTGQISLSDLSPDRLTQYSRITTHIWIYCIYVCGQAQCSCSMLKKPLLVQSMTLQMWY